MTPSNPAPVGTIGFYCGSPGDTYQPGGICPNDHPNGHFGSATQNTIPNGYIPYYVPYPGDSQGGRDPSNNINNDAKIRQGLDGNNRNPHEQLPTILICYSASVDSCIISAYIRVQNNQPVKALVLLGGSYQAYLDNTNTVYGFDTFQPLLTKINQSGTDILMLSDSNGNGGGSAALGFVPELSPDSGRFVNDTVPNPHFEGPPGTNIDDDMTLRANIYEWIFNQGSTWPPQ